MPATPTVSICALSSKERPPPVPCAIPTTLGRPGLGSSNITSTPACSSQLATKCAISRSPAPPGTKSGLTESMATSCCKRVVISFIQIALSPYRNRVLSDVLDQGLCDQLGRPWLDLLHYCGKLFLTNGFTDGIHPFL